jgi:hypothetical protein
MCLRSQELRTSGRLKIRPRDPGILVAHPTRFDANAHLIGSGLLTFENFQASESSVTLYFAFMAAPFDL